MKKSGEDRLKQAINESTLSTAARSDFSKGEGKEEAAWPQKGSQPRLATLGSPFLWKEVPRRGGDWMGIPLSPTQSLPRVGNAVKLR